MKARTGLALVLLPLVAVITLFAFVDATVSYYRLPVTGIEIVTPSVDGMIAVDLARYDNDTYIVAEVRPAEAADKGYSLAVEGLSGTPSENLTLTEDGLVEPHGTGVFRVTAVSDDGGFRDSVAVGVYSSATLSFSVRAESADGREHDISGGDAVLPTGTVKFFADTYPAEVCPDVLWSVTALEGQPEGSCSVNAATGEAQFAFSGKYAVRTRVSPAIEQAVENVFVVEVRSSDDFSLNGVAVDCVGRVAAGASRSVLFVSCGETPSVTDRSAGVDGAEIAGAGEGRYCVTVRASGALAGEYVVLSGAGKSVRVDFEESTADITGRYSQGGELLFAVGVGATLVADGVFAEGVFADGKGRGLSADESLSFETSGDIFLSDGGDGTCTVYAESAGTGVVRLYAGEGEDRRLLCERAVRACEVCAALSFTASSEDFGIEDELVVGGLRYDGDGFSAGGVTMALTAVRGGRVATVGGEETTLSLTGAKGEVATTEEGAEVRAVGDGAAVLTAEWKYAKAFYCDIYADLTLRLVGNAVNADDEASLRAAMESGLPAALACDIALGEKLLDDNGLPVAGAAVKQDAALGTLPTSADWTYYRNNTGERPDVRYCLDITADIYGNGRSVDADRITEFNASVSSEALFRGPLYFASLPSVASVTAQDNIVFLVRTDGVHISNVSLKGCADEALYAAGGSLDLEGLRYRGTVLEIMADCTVTASRISGGRTAVRVFGRDGTDPLSDAIDPAAERIVVTLDRCVVACAREFLVKVGTNRKVRGHYDENDPAAISPLLAAEGVTFLPRDDSNADSAVFRDNFLLTDLTIKDCVLYGSGLFAVGVECGFAGELLDGAGSLGSLVAGAGWKGLAGTSYAAALHIAGDTRFYEWKELGAVDSSTLIETCGGGALWDYLNLDIKEMLHKVREYGGEEYRDIIAVCDGVEYVHGGIAFYGGGKNYSVIDFSEYTGAALTEYSVNLSVLAEGEKEGSSLYLQGTSLPLAAGGEDFRFFVADAASEFGVRRQSELFSSGKAFDCLF